MSRPLLGFFTRVLDEGGPAARYAKAGEQIRAAEHWGLDSAWVAQHHFHENEGGLPSPLVFLAHVAAQTSVIRLGTGIITLPLENAVRVAEDAVVLDTLSGGRVELGFGSGGTPSSFPPFGTTLDERHARYDANLAVISAAVRGEDVVVEGNRLYPTPGAFARPLADRIWEATFSVRGAIGIGSRGNGLMLSRTQPRDPERPNATLSDIQNEIVDAYLAHLPGGVEPRITASRSAFVADTEQIAHHHAALGLPRLARFLGADIEHLPVPDLIRRTDSHVGTPEQVVESLATESVLERATEIVFQVHSIDPPHDLTLRHIELLATSVAPQLGWGVRLGERAFAGASA